MTADEARGFALAEVAESIRMGNGHVLSMEHLARAQVYATLALSLAAEEVVVDRAAEGAAWGCVPDAPPILRLLDLSTAHLPPEVCLGLNSYDGVIAYPKNVGGDDYGWWLHVDEYPQEHADDHPGFPASVLTVQLYARSLGCDWVMFDRDAPAIDELPRWEW